MFQGSYQILIKALSDAGDGKWFILWGGIKFMPRQERISGLQDNNETVRVKALLFVGAYITGGIVGYDSDIKSGGFGGT